MDPWKFPPVYDRDLLTIPISLLNTALKEKKIVNFFEIRTTYTTASPSHWDSWDIPSYGYGWGTENSYAPDPVLTIQAVYEYFRMNPESHLDEITDRVFAYMCGALYSGKMYLRLLDLICLCLYYQDIGTAPFNIDFEKHINRLRETIKLNKGVIKYDKNNGETYWKIVTDVNENLEKRFGYKLL